MFLPIDKGGGIMPSCATTGFLVIVLCGSLCIMSLCGLVTSGAHAWHVPQSFTCPCYLVWLHWLNILSISVPHLHDSIILSLKIRYTRQLPSMHHLLLPTGRILVGLLLCVASTKCLFLYPPFHNPKILLFKIVHIIHIIINFVPNFSQKNSCQHML